MDIKGTAKTTMAAVPVSPPPPVPPSGAHRGGATLRFEKIETSAQFRDQKMDIIGTAKTTMSTVPSAPCCRQIRMEHSTLTFENLKPVENSKNHFSIIFKIRRVRLKN